MQVWQPWQLAAGRWQQAEHLRPLPAGKQDLHHIESQGGGCAVLHEAKVHSAHNRRCSDLQLTFLLALAVQLPTPQHWQHIYSNDCMDFITVHFSAMRAINAATAHLQRMQHVSMQKPPMFCHCHNVPIACCCSTNMQTVTCVVPDTLNNAIWTGHEDGLVTVLQVSEQIAQSCKRASTCAAVSSMTVDAWGRCWVGHEDGTLQVLDYATRQQKALYAAEPFASIKPAPVSALHSWRGHVFSSEGWCSVRLWDGISMKKVTLGDCGCAGAVISLATVENHDLQRSESAVTGPREVPADAAGTSGGAGSSGIMCRLLSGHGRGQIVIWQFTNSLRLVPEALVGIKQDR